jgi:hypothetical protein
MDFKKIIKIFILTLRIDIVKIKFLYIYYLCDERIVLITTGNVVFSLHSWTRPSLSPSRLHSLGRVHLLSHTRFYLHIEEQLHSYAKSRHRATADARKAGKQQRKRVYITSPHLHPTPATTDPFLFTHPSRCEELRDKISFNKKRVISSRFSWCSSY